MEGRESKKGGEVRNGGRMVKKEEGKEEEEGGRQEELKGREERREKRDAEKETVSLTVILPIFSFILPIQCSVLLGVVLN